MFIRRNAALPAAIALTLGLGLSACSDYQGNRSVYSTKQPVVERSNYTLDVYGNTGGLPVSEQARLTDWFETMDLRYGDRVAIDGTASDAVRDDVAEIAARHGILLTAGAPITSGFIEPGMVRVVVTRSHAYVPGCPDWEDDHPGLLGNKTTADYGCAVNGNLAAMVADPEHLLHGAEGTGETVVMSSTKAIQSYRAQEPTGKGGLPEVSTGGGN